MVGRWDLRGSALWALGAGVGLSVPAAIASRMATVPFNVSALEVFSALWFLSMASLASALQTRTAIFLALPGRRRSDGVSDTLAIALQSLTLTVLVMTAALLLG